MKRHYLIPSLKSQSMKSIVSLTFLWVKNASLNDKAVENSLSTQKIGLKRKRFSSTDSDKYGIPKSKRIKRDLDDFYPRKSFENCLEKANTRATDDLCTLRETKDIAIIMRRYFSGVTESLWSEIFCHILRKLDCYISNTLINSTGVTRILEILFCSKVLTFSTNLFQLSNILKYEKIIFERLYLCRKLETMFILDTPSCPTIETSLIYSLSKFKSLRILVLMPAQKYSFHWAISIISEHCKQLKELSIVYCNENCTSEDNIESLNRCSKLEKICLYSYGIKCEWNEIRNLLINLRSLRHLFHKELPNALMQLYDNKCTDNLPVLNLLSLVLVDWVKSTGLQLIYIPNKYIVKISEMCPYLNALTLVQPNCLLEVTSSMKHLKCLILHQIIFGEVMKSSLTEKKLINLNTLQLFNIELITYSDIVDLSQGCPRLEDLRITNSNVVFKKDLFNASSSNTCSYPFLRSLVLLHKAKEPTSFLQTFHWDVGKFLSVYLLQKAKDLEKLHVEYVYESSFEGDAMSMKDFLSIVKSCKFLKELMILSTAFEIDSQDVDELIQNNEKLERLINLKDWNILPREKEKVFEKHNHLNFCC